MVHGKNPEMCGALSAPKYQLRPTLFFGGFLLRFKINMAVVNRGMAKKHHQICRGPPAMTLLPRVMIPI
jgi:hypothetical protein